ncbi:MAG: type II secretion system protein [Candidatus Omnitrophica bacterium]|nr:type II secretion system protein [Candidatus Omnitrophota bacterium]
MEKAFTLLELIVVIVILGILATLGYSQYTKIVEQGRGAEVRGVLGQIRKFAIAYRLEKGTTTGIQDSDVNIGTNPDQIPHDCVSSNYFHYWVDSGWFSDPYIRFYAARCTSGGKPPQSSCSSECRYIYYEDLTTGWKSSWFQAGSADCCPSASTYFPP